MKFDMNSNWLPKEEETEDGGIIIDIETNVPKSEFEDRGFDLSQDFLSINGKEVVSISPEYLRSIEQEIEIHI